jgi:general secretion pathway protein E
VQAALTGHLVLSTVHTNDAVGAITRLRDMRVEPFLIASTLRMVIAQRLVRRLCPTCREPMQATGSLAASLGSGARHRHLRGARLLRMRATGYRGRIGLFEVVRVDDTVRRLINAGGDEAAIAEYAFRNAPSLTSCGAADGTRRRHHGRGGGAGVASRRARSDGADRDRAGRVQDA